LRPRKASPTDGDSSTSRRAKSGRGGAVTSVVIGVEGSVVQPGRPDDDSVADLQAILLAAGYRVAVREKRVCSEPACKIEALIDWNQATAPPGWHDAHVCGRHNYRTCASCKSVFTLTSSNFVGQAPSLHCEVCGHILIEWGRSKLWIAELVTSGAPVLRRRR
jgi:hypothetical protein